MLRLIVLWIKAPIRVSGIYNRPALYICDWHRRQWLDKARQLVYSSRVVTTRNDTRDMPEKAPKPVTHDTDDTTNQSRHDTIDTTGLEDFFSRHDKDNLEDLTLEEASVRLNLSERTIQRRLKQGQLKGYKIPGPRGPEWRIQIKATDDTTQDMSPTALGTTAASLVTTVINPMASQDKTETEHANSQPVSEVFEFYKEQIDMLHDKLEAATYRNGYLEAQLSAAQSDLKLLPDLSAKASQVKLLETELASLKEQLAATEQGWLSKFGRWFFGRTK